MTECGSDLTNGELRLGYEDEEAHPMDDYYTPTSAPSSYIPSMTLSRKLEEEVQGNQFLMTSTKQKVSAPCIAGLVPNPRPGWIERSPRKVISPLKRGVSFKKQPQEKDLGITCHD